MEIVPRSAWGAAPPRKAYVPRRSTRFVVLHHTAGPNAVLSRESEASYCRQMQRFHQGKGWGDIGQHWTVMRSGRIYEGRPEGVIGVHCPGRNSDSVGIEVQGTFLNGWLPSKDQLQALGWLVGQICRRYGLDPQLAVTYHRAWYRTACPGDLVSLIPDIVAIASSGGISSSMREVPEVNIWQPQAATTGQQGRMIYVGYVKSDWRLAKADLLQTAWVNFAGTQDNTTVRLAVLDSRGQTIAGPWEYKLGLNQKVAVDLWAAVGARNTDGFYSWWSDKPVRVAETVYVVSTP